MNDKTIIAEKEAIIAQLLIDNKRITDLESRLEKTILAREIERKEKEKEREEKEKERKAKIILEQKLYDVSFQLEQLKKQIFGTRSERRSPEQIPNQLPLDFTDFCGEETPEQEKQTVTYQRKKRQENIKPVRQSIPDHLPRVEHVIKPEGDLSAYEKIGEEVTEELEYQEPKLFVNKYIREKYVAKNNTDLQVLASEVKIGNLPSRPIEKGIPGPRLLAQLIVSKYVDHLPIYRQRQMFKRLGIDLSESTVYGWMSSISKLLEPLYEQQKTLILELDYLMVDETPIKVLDPSKKKTTHRGWFWVYYSPLIRQVFFDYRKGRDQSAPKDILETYRGYLQTDGYAAYQSFEDRKQILLLGCMAHARRKFIEAEKQDPHRAQFVLSSMQKLYALEKVMREENWSAEKIKLERQEKSTPILKALQVWMLEQYPKATPKSAIGKALKYSLERWHKLMRYTTDGKLQIDNNLIENQIRPVALGRKNYLFAGSHDAAKTSAIYYSLLGGCRHNNINPMDYFTKVLSKIGDTKTNQLIKLLPGSIHL